MWTLNECGIKRLLGFERSILRKIFGLVKEDTFLLLSNQVIAARKRWAKLNLHQILNEERVKNVLDGSCLLQC